jgi:hypothetical protein
VVALGEDAATEPIAEAAFDPGASDDDEEAELDEPVTEAEAAA